MRVVLPVLLALLAPAASAQTPPVPGTASTLLADHARDLVGYLNGQGEFDRLFATAFRAEIPREKVQPLIAQLAGAYGKALGIESLVPTSPWSADIRVAYERGTVLARIGIDPAPPHQISGLLITGSEARDDSVARLDRDFAALPGQSGVGIYALDAGGVQPIHEYNGERVAPIASAFKLWILAEAARQVAAGERRWSDVVPVGPPSRPSGILQSWPAGTPVTLQTLATLMISISDNTAADTLLGTLGRARVDAMVAQVGTADSARATPVLTTREMFVLKGAAARDLAARWPGAGPQARRTLLSDHAARLAATPVEAATFRSGPVLTETLEWFATPRDEAKALDWLRLHGGETALAILALSPGSSEAIRSHVAYFGGKGGSEPGVVALNYLVRDKAGRWFAVTANWHRTDGEVEATRFATLVDRAVRLAVGR